MDFRLWFPFPLWVWFIIISINLVWSCSPRSASAAPTFSECGMDSHCHYGQYCHLPTKSCVNCTDCSKFKLKPGNSNCAKGKNECGQCQQGFTMDEGGHCSADHPKINSGFEPSSNAEPGGISLVLIAAAALCVPLLLVLLAFAGVMYYKKLRIPPEPPSGTELALVPCASFGSRAAGSGGKNTECIEMEGLPEEYYPPPPYNNLSEVASSRERATLLSAVPTGPNDLGNFPSQNIHFQVEDDAVVPDLSEQANIADAIAPHQSSMQVYDEQISASMTDLGEYFSLGDSNNSSSGITGESEPELPNQQQQNPIPFLGNSAPSFRVDIPPRASTPIVDMEHEQHIGSGSSAATGGGPSSNNDSGFSPPPEEFLPQINLADFYAILNLPNGPPPDDQALEPPQLMDLQPGLQQQLALQPGIVQMVLDLDEGIHSFNSDFDAEMEGSHVNHDVPEQEDLYPVVGEGEDLYMTDDDE